MKVFHGKVARRKKAIADFRKSLPANVMFFAYVYFARSYVIISIAFQPQSECISAISTSIFLFQSTLIVQESSDVED